METMMMLSPEDPGWARAWGESTRVYGDPACAHPAAGGGAGPGRTGRLPGARPRRDLRSGLRLRTGGAVMTGSVPCRVVVFADQRVGRRGRGVAWQAHNADRRMERAMRSEE